MAETPSIPRTPSSPPVASNTPVITTGTSPAAVQAPGAAHLNLEELPVRQAPAALTTPPVPQVVEGKVIASNTQAQEMRIQTPLGEVEVRSATPLPVDTEVSVEIYTSRNQTTANIVVLKQALVQAQQLEQIIPPQTTQPTPPLQVGQSVTAILLPEHPAVKIEQPAKAGKKSLSTPEVPSSSGARPAAAPPSTPEQPETPENTGNEQKISSLPPAENAGEAISAIGQKQTPAMPAAIQKLVAAYLPQIFGRPAIPATPESNAPDTLDKNLVDILHAQLQGRTTAQAAKPSTPALQPAPSASGMLGALLSIAEKIKPQLGAPLQPAFQQATPPLPEMYQLKILKILPPGTPPEQIKAALQKMPQPGAQPATVESVTPGGFPILKTDDSHFVIKTPASIPVGSVAIFQATPLTPEQIIASLQPQTTTTARPGKDGIAPPFDPLLSPLWPALNEALQAIEQSNPAMAQAIRHSLPTPTQHLVPTALFFLAALRTGSVDNWLGGNTLKALQAAGKKELADRLGGDFGKISSQSREALADDWRSISIPLMHDDQISQMQLYIRRQHDQDSGGKDGDKKPATRFLLNLQLSRMGEMQLDGFVQKKHFDVILRSEDKLPFDMRQELMKRFALGLEQVNMQGGISFQTRRQSWVTVEIPRQGGVEA